MRQSGIIDSEALTDPHKALGAYWILREGDRVLFKFSNEVEHDEVLAMREAVKAEWPGVPCLFVVGDIEVTVIGPPDA